MCLECFYTSQLIPDHQSIWINRRNGFQSENSDQFINSGERVEYIMGALVILYADDFINMPGLAGAYEFLSCLRPIPLIRFVITIVSIGLYFMFQWNL